VKEFQVRKANAFTLIELLVVIAIIALLVSILVPSLTRARDMARKAICSGTINSHGKAMAMYVSSYDSFPVFAPVSDMNPRFYIPGDSVWGSFKTWGWPTFYTILDTHGRKGTERTTWGIWYYGGPVDQVWDGCLCPAMDAPSIWAAADNAASFGGYDYLHRVSWHKWTIGYQWNVYLRSAVPLGRYPTTPGPQATWQSVVNDVGDVYQWHTGRFDTRDGEEYHIQAIKPDELSQPSDIAQAWDSWDLDSTPNIPWTTAPQGRGYITPGFHTGPPSFGYRVAFNGFRHKSCPNILYADGHVMSDAKDKIDAEKDGIVDWDPAYAGLQAYTWSHSGPRLFGNYDKVVPVAEVLTE
jgi:prepilin-type N-terminal cleavage/methylation domain-containing protein/prepilin-type processing-associated H-X9-DG protein